MIGKKGATYLYENIYLRERFNYGTMIKKDGLIMLNISSSEFKKQMGAFLAGTHNEPIQIEKAGKPVAVVLSPSEYAYLQQLEEQYWIARADAVEESGEWIDHEEAIQHIAAKLREAE